MRPTTLARWLRRRWRTWFATRSKAAYRRTDLFDRRQQLMDEWAAYLAGGSRGREAGPIR